MKKSDALRIIVRRGQPEDFKHINDLAATAIYPAFAHPELTDEQQAENRRIVGMTHNACVQSLQDADRAVFVAHYEGALAGFVIADKATQPCPEIDWFIVFPTFQGHGVAQELMATALAWIGPDTDVMLGVIHYNTRAIAFYQKHGFEDTDQIIGKHKIPRTLMIRKKITDDVSRSTATLNCNQ
ncbi:MAG: hypothetical protein GFH27_549281n74 [Chloroflexi bacterium AL-W]|nr:hypothetical protein [Chloroflexi bacterium AL-N1]NOK65960.1 hypothetical protein [Chloroflexi bacterium AL-N10]NOK72841.1 hypothetical protein [Chloroflexi bacterium AL-N5]NOK79738.1 hypothetical protein [Chloroflexi bacterium AL-W]NOK88406.1 hypothetical protein [Chloroflexi bacterium AL-N15]